MSPSEQATAIADRLEERARAEGYAREQHGSVAVTVYREGLRPRWRVQVDVTAYPRFGTAWEAFASEVGVVAQVVETLHLHGIEDGVIDHAAPVTP